MKINKLSFTNKDTDWRLEPATFDQLTLLVGASGVGKTRILKSILALKNITQGRSVNGAKWLVEFSTVDKNEYKNVIGSIGIENKKRIIIGAHYDVCGDSEGADDNASGVVGLLELARLL